MLPHRGTSLLENRRHEGVGLWAREGSALSPDMHRFLAHGIPEVLALSKNPCFSKRNLPVVLTWSDPAS